MADFAASEPSSCMTASSARASPGTRARRRTAVNVLNLIFVLIPPIGFSINTVYLRISL
jgi:hypothetical protein